jgi:hypothetical protein
MNYNAHGKVGSLVSGQVQNYCHWERNILMQCRLAIKSSDLTFTVVHFIIHDVDPKTKMAR